MHVILEKLEDISLELVVVVLRLDRSRRSMLVKVNALVDSAANELKQVLRVQVR